MHACSRLERRICAAVFLQPPVRQRQPLLLGLCTCVGAVLYGCRDANDRQLNPWSRPSAHAYYTTQFSG